MRVRVVVALSATFTLAVGAPALAGAGGWSILDSPGGDVATLSAMDFSSSHDGWAVGSTGTSLQGSGVDTTMMRWDGASWQTVASFAPAQSDEALTGVTATGPNSAWAVGWHDPYGTTRVHGLTLRWNGAEWVVWQDAPHSPILVGIDARTPTDIWAVGNDHFTHFDGKTWTDAAFAPVGAHPNAVTVLANDNAWAVGGIADSRPGYHHDVTYIAHWDGSSWSSVPSPLGLASGSFSGVSGSSASDIWAVGTVDNQPVAIRYDGSSWQEVAVPGVSAGSGLQGVVALAANDVWAVGNRTGTLRSGSKVWRTLTEHWDGFVWRIVPSPNDSIKDNFLTAAAAAGGRVWTVGGDGNSLIMQRQR